ncbi:MAG: hypothetical protein ACM3PD_02330 [Chloroflexota bacterium]
MSRLRVWRNAILVLIGIGLGFVAWTNRYEPAASPYFHRNRFTGAECHRGKECWAPRLQPIWADLAK